ncbi:MAG: L-ribulose-5-phosphate 3-epimerase [Clostridiales bacterium]|nr:L-ribulose-5-phosphate 3-epimerase [Clostridiales bacterium]
MEKLFELGLYEKAMPNNLNWEEKLKFAKSVGYDFVEISIDETDEKLSRLNMSKEERKNLVNLMMDNNIYIRTMCLSGHRKYPLGSNNKETVKRSLDIMEKAIILANDLGIRIIQIAGYDVYYEDSSIETVKRFEENLKKSTEIAAKFGVILAFETMETEFMNTVEKAMDYVNKINSPYLQVYPDIGNITNASKLYNKDVLKDLETGKGHIVGMHLKETVPNKFREIPFGTGHVDFEKAINLTFNLGVRKYVTELWCTNDKWQQEVKEAYNMMNDILKNIG